MTRYPLNLPVIYFAARCPLASNRQMQNGQTLHSFAYVPHALIRLKDIHGTPGVPSFGRARRSSLALDVDGPRAAVRHLPTFIKTGHLSFFLPITMLLHYPSCHLHCVIQSSNRLVTLETLASSQPSQALSLYLFHTSTAATGNFGF
jgi:hypothetical protein